MQYKYIVSDDQLAAFCHQAAHTDAIAVDTEFVRTRTLYPKLGLIQLYDGQELVLVDPQTIEDFEPLKSLLLNPDVIKVLHSCSEDLETFLHSLGVIPDPIFDTQFAACILDMGPTLGYANLVELMLGIKLDKGESRTDWTARPLTEQQLNYAANDVLYLHQLFPELYAKTQAAGRLDWVFDEMRHLARKKQQKLPTELAYLGIKNNWQLHGKALFLLKQLATWRVEQAMKRDLALNFIVREQNLVEIAKRQPQHKGTLFQLNGMTPQEARINGDAILEIVAKSKDIPPELYPAGIERLVEYPGFKKTAAAIRSVCQDVADSLNIPVEIVGSKKQIHQLLKWLWFDLDETREMGLTPDLLSGWRQPLLQSGIENVMGTKLEK